MKLLIAAVLALATVSQAYLGQPLAAYPVQRSSYPFGYNAVPYTTTGLASTYNTAPYTFGAVAPAYTSSQYHAQDELGQASYGYAHPGQSHTNFQDASGNQVGSYAYISPEGKEIRVNYIADRLGFRVVSNALPVGPTVPAYPTVALPVGPSPVQDTPEVVAARAEHLAAVAAAKSGRSKRGLVATTSPVALRTSAWPYAGVYGASPLAYAGYAHPIASPALAYPGYAHSIASPLAYSGYAHTVAAPVAAAVPSAVLREATLTKIVHNPNHAVSYRVD